MLFEKKIKFYRFFLLSLLFIFTLRSSAYALNRKGQLGLSASGSFGFPVGDMNSLWEEAFGFTGSIDYFLKEKLDLGIYYNYLAFQGITPGQYALTTDLPQQKWHIYGIFSRYILNPEKQGSFYLKASASTNNFKSFSPDDSLIEKRTDQWGINGGVGYKYDLSKRIGFYGETLFNIVFAALTTREYVSLNLGATFYIGKSKEE